MNEPINIFVIEDNPDHARLTKGVLEKKFNTFVDIEDSGATCLRKLGQKSYDLILLDYMLPDQNGLEVLRQIKEKGLEAAVIMITGQGDEKVAVEAMKAGAYDYIVKTPDYLTSLPLVVERVIERHRLAVEHYKMQQEIFRKNRELAALNDLSATISTTVNLNQILSNALAKTLEILNISQGAIYLVDESRQEAILKVHRGFPRELIKQIRRISLKDQMLIPFLNEDHLVMIGDHQGPSHQFSNLGGKYKIKNAVHLRLMVKGKCFGALIIAGRPFTPDEMNILKAIGNQVSVAIERAKLFEREQERIRELSILNAISKIVNRSLNMDEILSNILDKVLKVTSMKVGTFYLLDEKAQRLVLKSEKGLPPEIREHLLNLILDEGWAGQFVQSGKVRVIEDISREPHPIFEQAVQFGFKSSIIVPIKVKDRIIGIMGLGTTEPRRFKDSEIKLLAGIGDRVGMAIENARLFAESKRLKDFNETIVQGLEEGILIEDPEGHITFVNPKMEQLIGYSRHELLGQHWSKIIPSTHLLTVTEETRKRPHGIKSHYEAALLSKNGREIPVIVSARPLFDNGKYQGTLAVFADISEQKKLELQLIQSEKLSAIGQLISGVAHELNNPLTGVIGFSQLLLGENIDETVRKDLEVICREAKRCQKIVNKLLTFARRHKPEKSYVNIHHIIESVLELREYQLKVENIAVVKDFAPELPLTMVDSNQIQQVFLNLINNAYQAIVNHRGNGRLIIHTESDGSAIRIKFIDNGPGIPKKHLGKIFDPFFTTKEVGQGTGLGLSICYGIIQEHEGKINVESRVGEGTTITIELPIKAEPPKMGKKTEGFIESLEKKEGKYILIVDDEEVISNLLTRVLSKDGHKIDIAIDGEQALEKIRSQRYDLIISDFKMPGMDGQTLFSKVKELDAAITQRMVFISGDILSVEIQNFLKQNRCQWLRKPFTPQKIRETIARVMAENKR